MSRIVVDRKVRIDAYITTRENEELNFFMQLEGDTRSTRVRYLIMNEIRRLREKYKDHSTPAREPIRRESEFTPPPISLALTNEERVKLGAPPSNEEDEDEFDKADKN